MQAERNPLSRLGTGLAALLRRAGRVEKSFLFAGCLAAILLYLFVEIAAMVRQGGVPAFDTAILLAFRDGNDMSDPIGPPWLEIVMRDFTALGGFAILATVTMLAVGYLFLTGRRHAAWLVILSVVGGTLLSQSLKWGYARPRPDLVPHFTAAYSLSFPSGHSMLSAAVYLTLGALLARTHSDIRIKVYLLSAAALLVLIVGISRVYLGVHWPTDVLAGWAGGAAWALLCWMLMLWLQGRGQVEAPQA